MSKHIIFDFDGTLADTLEVGFANLREFAKANAYELPEMSLAEVRQKTIREHVRSMIPRYRLDLKYSFLRSIPQVQALLLQQTEQISLFTGIPELIKDLSSEHTLAILTSNLAELVAVVLKQNDLAPYFDQVVAQPKLWQKAKTIKKYLKEHRLHPSDVLMIGDETRDWQGAQKAGIPFIGVSWGFESPELLKKSVPVVVDSVPQLRQQLSATINE